MKTRLLPLQHGISLLTVMVILLLSSIAVLGSFRVAHLAQIMQGNDSDYERAFAAAEAVLRDAEIDVRGRLPPYNFQHSDGQAGAPCLPAALDVVGCRQLGAQQPWFPQSSSEFDELRDLIDSFASANNGVRCRQGICIPQNINAPANTAQQLVAMRPFGACYGQFTRRGLPPDNGLGDTNPSLVVEFDGNRNCTQARAWYWVELFRFNTSVGLPGGAANLPTPELNRNFLYRITAVAQGLREGTQVVLQSIFIPFPA